MTRRLSDRQKRLLQLADRILIATGIPILLIILILAINYRWNPFGAP